jgi:hypothetical protein
MNSQGDLRSLELILFFRSSSMFSSTPTSPTSTPSWYFSHTLVLDPAFLTLLTQDYVTTYSSLESFGEAGSYPPSL